MLVGQAPFSFGNSGNVSRNELYRRILRGVVTFPSTVSSEARDFITMCMQRRPKDRPLMKDLKKHKIFKTNKIDFEKLKRREVPPPHKIKIDEACIKAIEGRLVNGPVDNIYKYVFPDNLVAHFDPRFTQEPPLIAPSTAQDGVTAEEDKHFREFNWTAPWAFDKVKVYG